MSSDLVPGDGRSPKPSPKLPRKKTKSKWVSASVKATAFQSKKGGRLPLVDDNDDEEDAQNSEGGDQPESVREASDMTEKKGKSKDKDKDRSKTRSKGKDEGGYKQKASLLSRTARHMMSRYQRKVRYKDGDYDLDLTYITPRIIAMSFPASGVEAIYRNNADDVAAMLKEKHGEAFMIINVAEKSYHSDGLKNQVLDFGWPDHMAPPIDRLLGCIQAMDGWNRSDENNVVAVHCKGGKGRTGVVIASYMLQAKNFVGIHSAEDAMDHFAITRFDSKDPMKYGISGKSQRRYVKYFKDIIEGNFEVYDRQMYLESVTMNCVPDYDNGGCRPLLLIAEFPAGDTQLREIYEWPPDLSNVPSTERPQTEFNQSDLTITIPVNKLIKLGDIVAFCYHKPKSGSSKKKKKFDTMWRVQFHTCSVVGSVAAFSKDTLDDTKISDARFPQHGMVTFNFNLEKSPKAKDKFNLGEGLKLQYARTEEDLLHKHNPALPELRASKIQMSDADRIEVMGMVKEGLLSVDEAVKQVMDKQRPESFIGEAHSESDTDSDDESIASSAVSSSVTPRRATSVDVLMDRDSGSGRSSPSNPFKEDPFSGAQFDVKQAADPFGPSGGETPPTSRKSSHRRTRSALPGSLHNVVNPFEVPSAETDIADRSAIKINEEGVANESQNIHRRRSLDIAISVSDEQGSNPFGSTKPNAVNPFETSKSGAANPFGAGPPKLKTRIRVYNPFDPDPNNVKTTTVRSNPNPFVDSNDRPSRSQSESNPFADDSAFSSRQGSTASIVESNPFANDGDNDGRTAQTTSAPDVVIPEEGVANPFSMDESTHSKSSAETSIAEGDEANPFASTGQTTAKSSGELKTTDNSEANPFSTEVPVDFKPTAEGDDSKVNPFAKDDDSTKANPFAEPSGSDDKPDENPNPFA